MQNGIFGGRAQKVDGGAHVGIVAMILNRTFVWFIEKTVITRIIKGIWILAKHAAAAELKDIHTIGKAGFGEEIVLAIAVDGIVILLEVLEHIRLVGPQQVPQGAVTAHMRMPTGHHATARRRADRVLHVALIEARSLGGKGIDVGGGGQGVAVTADTLGTQLVWLKDDEVHDGGLQFGRFSS